MMDSYKADLIAQDIESAENITPPENINIFKVKTFNKALKDAKERPDLKPLYDKLWYESEVCCLYADSNLGKSILAVQIADHIARAGKRVIYFDIELSDKQFQSRYTSKEGYMCDFPDTLIRAEINIDKIHDEPSSATMLGYIKEVISSSYADVAIIDNITMLCAELEKGSEAGKIMNALKNVARELRISMLIIAHTPKRDASRPITRNDLAGSSRLYNLCDSAFAIGRSAKDENLRYIKQIKCRQCEFTYDAENVIVCSLEKSERGYLRMIRQGFSSEREHLREQSDKDSAELIQRVKELASEGKSTRDIAKELGITPSKAYRIIKKDV